MPSGTNTFAMSICCKIYSLLVLALYIRHELFRLSEQYSFYAQRDFVVLRAGPMENFARGEPWKTSSYNIPALPHVGVEEESACPKEASPLPWGLSAVMHVFDIVICARVGAVFDVATCCRRCVRQNSIASHRPERALTSHNQ